MNCHSQLFADSPMLHEVRDSFRTDKPLSWTRVHNLPDFVYFNHSIHVHKGIACTKCHGPVNEMPLMWRVHTLHMQWCLECHRQPTLFVGPRAEVFNANATSTNDPAKANDLIDEYHIKSKTSCYTCHR